MTKKLKLEIELIPSSNWGFNLRSILKKSDWDKIRKLVYKNSNYRCEICSGKGVFGFGHPVECHEKWEFDDTKKTQKLVGLLSLCPPCHRVKHYGRTSTIGGTIFSQTKNHFLKVNDVGFLEMNNHIDLSFALFEKRSKEEWALDISDLENIIKNII